jgi:hypothetical protein
MVAEANDLDPGLIEPTHADRLGWSAERPRRAALGTARARLLPTLQAAVDRFATAMRHR